MKQNTKAIIYVRSAGGNVKSGEPTVQDQVDAVRKYCKANHIDVMMEMTEFGSDSTMFGPGLIGQIKHVTKNQHNVDAVVTHDISRISRDPVVIHKFMKNLEKTGTKLHFVKENRPDELAAAFAKFYLEQLSEKIKAGIKHKKMEQDKNKTARFTATGRKGKKSHYQKEIVQPSITRRLTSK